MRTLSLIQAVSFSISKVPKKFGKVTAQGVERPVANYYTFVFGKKNETSAVSKLHSWSQSLQAHFPNARKYKITAILFCFGTVLTAEITLKTALSVNVRDSQTLQF